MLVGDLAACAAGLENADLEAVGRLAEADIVVTCSWRAARHVYATTGKGNAQMTKKPKGERHPRVPLPPGLPMTFEAAEEASIIDTVDGWFVRIADKLSSEAAHAAVRDDIYRQLEQGAGALLPLEYIVDMAKAGHPPAAR
jgi:hypothetical protein